MSDEKKSGIARNAAMPTGARDLDCGMRILT
jgi:hypothetical protein